MAINLTEAEKEAEVASTVAEVEVVAEEAEAEQEDTKSAQCR